MILTRQKSDTYRAAAKAAGASDYVPKQAIHSELIPKLAVLLTPVQSDEREVSRERT
ncbi:MAG: hypothetical protein MAG451_02893 [Anaerolineales bacterium]|nr:hypothetical protein [Anaerolineales bacterium]